jgi:hypothetical protein
MTDAAMQDYYAARAREYDEVYRKPERQADLREIERWLDGSAHRVMKNFPTRDELLDTVAGVGHEVRHRTWAHYWALEYPTRAA